MSSATEEIVRVCETLPLEKQREVIEFARFLQTQNGDEEWERIIAAPVPRPKLEAFLDASIAKGHAPMDFEKL